MAFLLTTIVGWALQLQSIEAACMSQYENNTCGSIKSILELLRDTRYFQYVVSGNEIKSVQNALDANDVFYSDFNRSMYFSPRELFEINAYELPELGELRPLYQIRQFLIGLGIPINSLVDTCVGPALSARSLIIDDLEVVLIDKNEIDQLEDQDDSRFTAEVVALRYMKAISVYLNKFHPLESIYLCGFPDDSRVVSLELEMFRIIKNSNSSDPEILSLRPLDEWVAAISLGDKQGR